MKESTIQQQTISLLAANGFLAIPVEARGRRGFPDLIVFRMGCKAVAFLELKTRKGKLSEIQIQTAALFKIWGHNIGVARDPDEALTFVQGVFNGNKEEETRETIKNTKAAAATHRLA